MKRVWKRHEEMRKKVDRYLPRLHRMQVICIISGMLLYIAVRAVGERGDVENGRIRRPLHGQGEKEYEIYIKGLGEEAVPLTVTVGEKEYGEEEADGVFEEAWKKVLSLVPADNVSISDVRSHLKLPVWLDEYGLRIRWFSENQELVDNYGKVWNENNPGLGEEGKEVWLRAVISDGKREREYQLPVVIKPPIWTEQEKLEKGLKKAIEAEDEKQIEEEWLILPEQYEGAELEYGERTGNTAVFFPAAGILMAVLYGFKEQQDEKQREKKRRKQLLLDYSEIVSRLMVFTGAGMTVRGAWGKIVADYERGVEEKRLRKRYAYEEMCRTYYRIQTGTAEGEAYEEFGRRCGLQPYMKLSGILLQNRKEGMKNFNQVMKAEMVSAFEERKNLARRQGEEAGTKLLGPLFLMLGVIMIMVMAPAMMAFS